MGRAKVVGLLGMCLLWSGACAALRKAPEEPKRQTALRMSLGGFQVSNGMQVFVVTDEGANKINLSMRYDVGAIDDPPGKAGMAHLAEHLLFRTIYKERELGSALGDVALDNNAYTRVSDTTYVSTIAPGKLEAVFELEAARLALRCQGITDEVFARDRDVVRQELRQAAETDASIEAVYRGIFGDHPVTRSVGGSDTSVASITKAEACAFIDKYYVPQNAVLVVSGKVTGDQVDGALSKMLGRLPARAGTAATRMPPATLKSGTVTVQSQLREPVALLAWSLPTDPTVRHQVLTVASMIAGRVGYHAKGSAWSQIYGVEGAESITIFIDPAFDETIDEALAAGRRGVEGILQWLEEETFETARQAAQVEYFTDHQESEDRDWRFAAAAASGAKPGDHVRAGLAALSKLDRTTARDIARAYLAWRDVRIVRVDARREATVAPAMLRVPLHNVPPVRAGVDPAAADQPAPAATVRHLNSTARVRTLANGLRVVMVPSGPMPTASVSLVFDSGQADEPADRRGVATFAAWALDFASSDFAAEYALFMAGSSVETYVNPHTSSFEIHGLDMYVDKYLLALERMIRNGRYPGLGVESAAARTRTALARGVDPREATIDQAVAAARFGQGHVLADILRPELGKIGADALEDFRRAHYRPGNATLVLTGGFDEALADQWIDYLFSDWGGGTATHTPVPAPTPRPQGIAHFDEALTQLQLTVYLPVDAPLTAKARGRQQVIAHLLAAAFASARAQGASYGISAGRIDRREQAEYVLTGAIDVANAGPALRQMAANLARVAAKDPAIKPNFVLARRDALGSLWSAEARARQLTNTVLEDLEADRDVAYRDAAAMEVAALTFDGLGDLSELSLDRAIVVLRGPSVAVRAGFDALGVKWSEP